MYYLLNLNGTLCHPHQRIAPEMVEALKPHRFGILTGGQHHDLLTQALIPLQQHGYRGSLLCYAALGTRCWEMTISEHSITQRTVYAVNMRPLLGNKAYHLAQDVATASLREFPLPEFDSKMPASDPWLDLGGIIVVRPVGHQPHPDPGAELARRQAFIGWDRVVKLRQAYRALVETRLADFSLQKLRVYLAGETSLAITLRGLDARLAVQRTLDEQDGGVVYVGDALWTGGTDTVLETFAEEPRFTLAQVPGPATTLDLLRQ